MGGRRGTALCQARCQKDRLFKLAWHIVNMFWLLIALLLLLCFCSWAGYSDLSRSATLTFETAVRALAREHDEASNIEGPSTPHKASSGLASNWVPSRATTSPRVAPVPRKRITPFQAKKIAARQGWTCGCGCGQLLDESFEIDHIVPLSEGGSNADNNLQALLRAHHQAKSSAHARRRP